MTTAVVAGAIILLLGVLVGRGAAGEVTRLQGDSRYATSVAVSEANWNRSDTVVLATASDYPDALAAAALAAARDAPLLLTDATSLPEVVAEEIDRLRADTAIIMGGTAAVSAQVASAVLNLEREPEVRRIDGAGRVETAALAAAQVEAPTGEAVVASAEDFPDALAASSLAAVPSQLPVLLSSAEEVPQTTLDTLEELRVTRVSIVGGPGVLAPTVEAQLVDAGYDVTRLDGDTRFTTSVAVAEDAFRRLSAGRRPLIVATGEDFVDALSAGALTARLEAPFILVPTAELTDPVADFLSEHAGRIDEVLVVGGTAAVDDAVIDQITEALTGEAPEEPGDDPSPQPDDALEPDDDALPDEDEDEEPEIDPDATAN